MKLDKTTAIIRWVNRHWSRKGLSAWDGSNGLSVLDRTKISIWVEHKKTGWIILAINDFKQAVVLTEPEGSTKRRLHWNIPPIENPEFFEFLDTCIEKALEVHQTLLAQKLIKPS